MWIITVLVMAYGNSAAAERLTVSAPVANIRSGPGATYDIIWKVERFHPLNVFETTGPWYHFRDFEGDEGWIHQSLVQEIPSIITNKEDCNIRSGPGTGFNIVLTVEKGVPFKVLKHQGSWIHIQHADGDQGWIHKSLVW